MENDWINALIGGVLIGISVSLMLFLNGRVTGISGILNGLLVPLKGDRSWRALFLLGLLVGGFSLHYIAPDAFSGQLESELWTTVVAGLLVGVGTVMGSGCTSGHGVCGISRLSFRSLLATLLFIFSGIVSVVLFTRWGML